jgi:hypothetical protein
MKAVGWECRYVTVRNFGISEGTIPKKGRATTGLNIISELSEHRCGQAFA